MVQVAAGSLAGGGHLLDSLLGVHSHMPEQQSRWAGPVTDPAPELYLFTSVCQVQGPRKLLSYLLLPGPCGQGSLEGSGLRDGHGAASVGSTVSVGNPL